MFLGSFIALTYFFDEAITFVYGGLARKAKIGTHIARHQRTPLLIALTFLLLIIAWMLLRACGITPSRQPADATDGETYVADGYGNSNVHRFAADGSLIKSWGHPGGEPGAFTEFTVRLPRARRAPAEAATAEVAPAEAAAPADE